MDQSEAEKRPVYYVHAGTKEPSCLISVLTKALFHAYRKRKQKEGTSMPIELGKSSKAS